MNASLRERLRAHIPTAETLGRYRLLAPLAPRLAEPSLWRFNRRSVPRGVALGVFVALLVPLAHFIIVAFLAVFLRANIPAALAATFVGFPVIYVAIVAVAYRLGDWLMHLDASAPLQPLDAIQASGGDALLRWLTGTGLDTALGLVIIASAAAVLGFAGTALVWRWRIVSKRRARLAQRRRAS